LARRSCPDRVRGSVLDRGEVAGDLGPVIDAEEAGSGEVVRGGVEDVLALESDHGGAFQGI
jgi:hypothetical protein